MNCTLCGQKLTEEDTLRSHLTHHVSDKQYGIKVDGLVHAICDLTVRVDKLEQLIKVLEIAHSGPVVASAFIKEDDYTRKATRQGVNTK